jgi:uncharacterized cupredoxin-like copper-binding protein
MRTTCSTRPAPAARDGRRAGPAASRRPALPRALLALAVLALLAGACGGEQATVGDDEGGPEVATGEGDAGDGTEAEGDAQGFAEGEGDDGGHEGHDDEPAEIPSDAQTLEVEATEFAFDPAEPEIEAARPVAVTFTNRGDAEHEWVLLDEGGSEVAHLHAAAGERARAVVDLQPGTYEAVCEIPGHAEQGMVGEVTAG